MPGHWWDYIYIHRTDDESSSMGHDLQAGLLQIASQTCNILVQVNNTNNITYGDNATNVTFNQFASSSTRGPPTNNDEDEDNYDDGCPGPSSSRSRNVRVSVPSDKMDREQSRDLLSKREKFVKRNSELFANYKKRLSVSGILFIARRNPLQFIGSLLSNSWDTLEIPTATSPSVVGTCLFTGKE